MDMIVAELLAAQKLKVILKEWSAEGAAISIVFPAALRNSLKVRVFADFATDLLLQERRRVDSLLESDT
jgi:hypothetical protein